MAIHSRISSIHAVFSQFIPEKKHFVQSMVIFDESKFITWQGFYPLSSSSSFVIHLMGSW